MTIGPGNKIRLGWVIGLASAIFVSWMGWLTSEVNTIKTGMFSRSTAEVAIQSKIDLLTFRMEQLEKKGSEPLQNLNRSIDEMRMKLDMHMGLEPRKGAP